MKKSFFLRLCVCVCVCLLFSLTSNAQNKQTSNQFSITGKITEENGQIIPNAVISLKNTFKTILGNDNGVYLFSGLSKGTYIIEVSFVGYQNTTQSIKIEENSTDNVSQSNELNFILKENTLLSEEVIVTATRATDRSGVAFKTISAQELGKQNLAQDLPVLLNFTPSMVSTSDAGAGVGYTSMRIRGSDQTRINVTINGIPLNDTESQGVFWVNMPDFSSSVESIQIQRGVGTSTNGAGAFGATVNVQTNTLQEKPYLDINNTFGSFGTQRNNIKVGTGLINGKFTADMRLSQIKSDGFVDRAASNMSSYYFSGAYVGKKTLVRINVFSGKEQTYQSWNGTPEAKVSGNPTLIQDYIDRYYLDAEDAQNMLTSDNRSFNAFTYNNQTDNYKQTHYQAIFSHEISKKWQANMALHYTKGAGYYEEYRKDQRFSRYGFPNAIITDAAGVITTIKRTDLVRQRWLDNDFGGFTFSADYNSRKNMRISIGGAGNKYVGKHFGEVIWTSVANANVAKNQRYYEGVGTKTDFNLFGKIFYDINNKITLFGDLQVRNITYDISGIDNNLVDVSQKSQFAFFNPKVGITYTTNDRHSFSGFFGIGNREPNRSDFVNSTPNTRPQAESLQNLEVNYSLKAKKMTFSANYFLMNYQNELVLTGKLNDVGANLRANVARSYRTGIELEFAANVSKKLTLGLNATFSQNKITSKFDEFVDNFDFSSSTPISATNPRDIFVKSHENKDLAFSPSVVGASQISYKIRKDFEVTLLTKYVGKQYLDNTQDESRSLKAYLTNDVRFIYTHKPKFMQEITCTFLINNALSELYSSNGYLYSYSSGGVLFADNYLYPQAGRNFLMSVGLKF